MRLVERRELDHRGVGADRATAHGEPAVATKGTPSKKRLPAALTRARPLCANRARSASRAAARLATGLRAPGWQRARRCRGGT